jgi:cell division protein FtsW (lipid II flippase)
MATGRIAYPLIGLVLFAAGAWFAYQAFDHVQLRVDVWLNALDPAKIYEQGYGQVANGQFALASGGLFGTGLGEGMPFLIPGDNAGATDFIFAAIGEELGLVGTIGVLMLLLGVVGKGFSTAVHAKDEFGKLLASGLAVLLGVQVFVIVAGVTRLIPLTGITLPFVSYGGSSLVANFIILALIVRVSSGPAPGSRR